MTRSERRRLEDVLPFYVNGRASAEDRAFVDALRADPDAASMLNWHSGLAEHVRADVESAPATIGWAALAAKVQAQRQAEASARGAGWRAWLSLDRWVPRNLQMPAFAVLALAVVGQSLLLSGVIGTPLDREYSEVRGEARTAEAGAADASAVALLRANFKDETSERDLRLLLVAVGASIVQGPGQLGDYTLSVPADRAAAALRELGQSPWVIAVRRVDAGAAAPR